MNNIRRAQRKKISFSAVRFKRWIHLKWDLKGEHLYTGEKHFSNGTSQEKTLGRRFHLWCSKWVNEAGHQMLVRVYWEESSGMSMGLRLGLWVQSHSSLIWLWLFFRILHPGCFSLDFLDQLHAPVYKVWKLAVPPLFTGSQNELHFPQSGHPPSMKEYVECWFLSFLPLLLDWLGSPKTGRQVVCS